MERTSSASCRGARPTPRPWHRGAWRSRSPVGRRPRHRGPAPRLGRIVPAAVMNSGKKEGRAIRRNQGSPVSGDQGLGRKGVHPLGRRSRGSTSRTGPWPSRRQSRRSPPGRCPGKEGHGDRARVQAGGSVGIEWTHGGYHVGLLEGSTQAVVLARSSRPPRRRRRRRTQPDQRLTRRPPRSRVGEARPARWHHRDSALPWASSLLEPEVSRLQPRGLAANRSLPVQVPATGPACYALRNRVVR
jgi:hypothetical protein